MLMADKVKSMTSDTDCLAVRQLYGTTREMPITWKLVLLCNTPPRYSQLDGAALERTQFVPCSSVFVPEADAPAREEDRYAQRRFVRQDIPPARQQELAQRLMAIFYATYVSQSMHMPSYNLRPPPRILAERDRQLQELSVFRMYLRAFLRPCSCLPENLLSAEVNTAAVAACRDIREAYEAWLRTNGRAHLRHVAWHRLPPEAMDPATVGSPGWVRCQCVHLLHFVARGTKTREAIYHPTRDQERMSLFTTLRVPYIDAGYVADQFNRYRRQHRVLSTPAGDGLPPEAAMMAALAAASSGGGRAPQCVTLDSRMRLDKMLVRSIMRDVTGAEADGDRFLGRCFLGPNNQVIVDNDAQTGMILDRVLSYAARAWYRRFRAPLAHPALVDQYEKESAVQGIIARRAVAQMSFTAPSQLVDIVDDWDKMVADNENKPKGTVWSDDEGDTGTEVFLPPEQPGGPMLTVTRKRVEPCARAIYEYRSSTCWMFPTDSPPRSVIQEPASDGHRNPVDCASPTTANEAESLLATESFWQSVVAQREAEESRTVRFSLPVSHWCWEIGSPRSRV